jgi:hypothetical protein
MLRLVESLDQLIANVKEYQKEVERVSNGGQRRRIMPSVVRDWYYIPSLGMVGPSRFIGYKGMTPDRYAKSPVNGGETERHLHAKGWFRQLGKEDSEYDFARRLAQRLCRMVRCESNVCSLAKFYILQPAYDKQRA